MASPSMLSRTDVRAAQVFSSFDASFSMDYSSGKNDYSANRNNKHTRNIKKLEIGEPAETIVVAYDARKEIRKESLEWTLVNIAQPGDCITILAVLSVPKLSWKAWNFPNFRGECATMPRFSSRDRLETEGQVKDSCRQILREVKTLRVAKKVHMRVKIVKSEISKGVTAREAKSMVADWVVLDRHLKDDGKCCTQQLDCNVVLLHHYEAKILRLNLRRTSAGFARPLLESPSCTESSLLLPASFNQHLSLAAENKSLHMDFMKLPYGAANQSPQPYNSEDMTSFTSTELGTSSLSSSDSNSSFSFRNSEDVEHEGGRLRKSDEITQKMKIIKFLEGCSGDFSPHSDKIQTNSSREPIELSPKKLKEFLGLKEPPLSYGNYEDRPSDQPLIGVDISRTVYLSDTFCPGDELLKDEVTFSRNSDNESAENASTTTSVHLSSEDVLLGSKEEADNSCLHKLPTETQIGRETTTVEELNMQSEKDAESTSQLQMSALSRRTLAGPPPLCSTCRYKAPLFGRPPQKLTYKELELATNGFSRANFLAEGGFGSVHRGVLPDGQAIAVKQHKLASLQADYAFCAEVDILSCAQHRNVVTLIGYCMEDSRRLLVYEFICNGSLDSHLYGHDRPVLEWQSRQRIAIGAARGLRYLHEECRVGCIIHRDMRPNNILLTHDFEPMVGDFGLARWQPDGDLGVETRVIGTFGYLAPEYVQSGHITEKADVYSFGVVLLEIATGRKAIDYSQPKGQQCLTEWARPLLENSLCHELADPQLKNHYNIEEMCCMLRVASLCIQRDPHLRPKMSQTLRFLEGDILHEVIGFSTISQQHSIPSLQTQLQ